MMAGAVIIQLIMFIIVGVGLYFLIKRKPTVRKRWISSRKMHYLLAGYIVILIISAVVYFLLPKEEIAANKETLKSMDEVLKESDNVNSFAYQGDFKKIDDKYVKERISFPYEEDTLEIDQSAALSGQWLIVVEKKESDDNLIDIAYYEAPSRMNGVDVSEYFGEVDIQIESNRLLLSEDSVQELSFSQFTKPFLLSQFSDEKDTGMNFDYYWGSRILHLSIPQRLEIINDYNDVIHYLDEEPE